MMGFIKKLLQAIGFYIISFILLIVISQIFKLIYIHLDVKQGTYISYLIGFGYCIGLSLLIVIKKKLSWNMQYILIVILSGVLYFFVGGAVAGLLPPAYLSTRKNLSASSRSD
jgi:hypothetical protein